MKLFLIDAIGPFFRGYSRKKINWSKIPFEQIATEGKKRELQFLQIRNDVDEFARKVSETGCNAVTLDQLAHLAEHGWYEKKVRRGRQIFGRSTHPISDSSTEISGMMRVTFLRLPPSA